MYETIDVFISNIISHFLSYDLNDNSRGKMEIIRSFLYCLKKNCRLDKHVEKSHFFCKGLVKTR